MSTSIQHSGEEKANEIRARLDAVIGRGQRTYTPSQLVVKKAEGSVITTADGKELIDFTSAVLVTNLGHAHPRFEELHAKYAAGLPRNAYNMIAKVGGPAGSSLYPVAPQASSCEQRLTLAG